MKQYKKRALALVLASTITVVGAFGAENYKNSLMSLGFKNYPNGDVNLTIYTKDRYVQNISPIRKAANTYEILLPETDSQLPSDIPIGRNVQSIDVRTLPYTNSGVGYTKIIVVTQEEHPLYLETSLYVEDKTQPTPQLETTQKKAETVSEEEKSEIRDDLSTMKRMNSGLQSESGVNQTTPVDIKDSVKQFQPSEPAPAKVKVPQQQEENTTQNEIIKFILGALLVVAIFIFFLLRAKEKMADITGEQLNLNLDDDDDKPKKIKKPEKPKINTTIKNLDKTYQKPISMPVKQQDSQTEDDIVENRQEVEEVVDLDKLLEEQNQNQPDDSENEIVAEIYSEDNEEHNSALEDFLSAYNFEDEEEIKEEEPTVEEGSFDEELYNKYINDDSLRFSKDDIDNIEALINSEISDETLKNPEKFLVSKPPQEKKPSTIEMLEGFVTAYTITQNVSFSKDDIDALKKLMSVELDNDFINDLKTDPIRREQMQEEFRKHKSKPHKTSELLTLNVKDMLPDLSEALKKQGGKKIESEVKPQVVYYSEGYDVSTLKVNNDILPDLAKEVDNDDAYKTRPSDEIELVDTSYNVQKMSIKDELPDLEDVLKNPDKYETSEEEPEEVDEEALLKNITNVTFKPFDDGSRNFEILNEIDESNAPTVSDMQKEFEQFNDNFEIVEEDDIPTLENNDQDDFESLYSTDYVDLDNAIAAEEKFSDKVEKTDAQKLLEQIKQTEEQRKIKAEQNKSTVTKETEEDKTIKEKQTDSVPKAPEFCVLDGERYSIVSINEFASKMGCYLAKNENGYCVIGYIGDKVYKIKTYEILNNENMQSRMSKKLENGTSRYIVRIGIHKFILNVDKDNMEFVMDLC